MQLEEYFDFINEDAIRIHGQRVDIAHVLAYYQEGYGAEIIALELPSLSLEEIHATITYYLRNQAAIDHYLERRLALAGRMMHEEDSHEPPAVVQKIRTLRAHHTRGQAA